MQRIGDCARHHIKPFQPKDGDDTVASLPDPEGYAIFTVAAMITSDLNGYDP
jgi:hypothetical protein